MKQIHLLQCTPLLWLLLSFIVSCECQSVKPASMMCPAVHAPVNGYTKGNCLSSTTGDTCVLFCNSGFKLLAPGKKVQKDGSLELKCRNDGFWDEHRSRDALIATCSGPSECKKDVSKMKDGFSKGACSPGYAGQVCEYQCRPGYKLDGPSGLVCLPNGKWNKDPPRCVIDEYNVGVKCSPLIYKKDGGVFLGSCSPGRLKQQCRLVCAKGYEIVSTQSTPPQVVTDEWATLFTCMSNGYWDKAAHAFECRPLHN